MNILTLPLIRHCASALLKCRSGNFGLLAALVAIPLIAALSVAIDFAAAVNRKAAMQSAADAAALAGAAAGVGSEQKIAVGFLGAHLGSNDTQDLKGPPAGTIRSRSSGIR